MNRWSNNAVESVEARVILRVLMTYVSVCTPFTTGSLEILTDSKNAVKWID